MAKKKPRPTRKDKHTPEWTQEKFDTAISGRDFFIEKLGKAKAEALFAKNKGGRPRKVHPKRQVTLRLDDDVLKALRARGRGWQSAINYMLREWVMH